MTTKRHEKKDEQVTCRKMYKNRRLNEKGINIQKEGSHFFGET